MRLATLARSSRSVAGRVVRCPRGTKLLAEALEAGLPEWLEEPMRYLVTERLEEVDMRRVGRVERLRVELAERRMEMVEILSSPAPVAPAEPSPGVGPPVGPAVLVDLHRVATHTSVDRTFGTLLYLVAKATGARTILELGSCAGIASSYMVSAGAARFVGVEGSPVLATIAQRNVRCVDPGARIVNALFDDALDELEWPHGIDMAWIDGQHERTATLHYLRRISEALNPGAIVLLDDIRWSPDMWAAWTQVKHAAGFGHTVDLGRVGAAVWRGNGSGPRAWDLSALRGRPPIGIHNPVAAGGSAKPPGPTPAARGSARR